MRSTPTCLQWADSLTEELAIFSMAQDSPDGAGLHGGGDRHGLVDVIGEHGGGQTVISVVGSLNHLLQGFELHDLLYWPKDLQK